MQKHLVPKQILENSNESSFSIIIPVYNKEAYILRAVSSVLNQNYEYFELILINDGSTDQSYNLLRQFKDSRIRIFDQKNLGVSAARNKGIYEAKYDYIVFLDGDDEWLPNYLFEIDKLIKKYPNAGIYGVNHKYVFSDGRTSFNSFDKIFDQTTRIDGRLQDYFYSFCKYGRSPFSNSGCCIPKKIFRDVGGYKHGVKLTEDSELWCRIALKYPIIFSRKLLCIYYLETTQNTRTLVQNDDYEVSKMLQLAINNNSVPQKYLKSVRKLIAFQQISLIRRALLFSHKSLAFQKLMDSRIFIQYPMQVIFFFLCIFVPNKALRYLNSFLRR